MRQGKKADGNHAFMKKLIGKARWIPFLAFGAASLWAAGQTNQGYRKPVFDWDLSREAIANALTKMPHIGSAAFIFALAAIAVGRDRLPLAAVLTFVVGVGWEIVQMPTIGNNPRLADLAPNMVGIAIGWTLFAAINHMRSPRLSFPSARTPASPRMENGCRNKSDCSKP